MDLHGNSKKKETAQDGSKDENVFDIQQGVSIFIGIKTKSKNKELAKVYNKEVFGKRRDKYELLEKLSLNDLTEITISKPHFEFKLKQEELEREFFKGVKLDELFFESSLGSLTKRDKLSVGFSEAELEKQISSFVNPEITDEEACAIFGLSLKDNDNWNAALARKAVIGNSLQEYFKPFTYRIFDQRKIFYQKEFVARINSRVMRHINSTSPALIVGRQGQAVGGEWNIVFISDGIPDNNIFRRGGGTTFPLYLYPEGADLYSEDAAVAHRRPNLKPEAVQRLTTATGLSFVPETTGTADTFAPEDVLDYVYGILHQPAYRRRYHELLRIDFPRVPLPASAAQFREVVEFGHQLRELHLLRPAALPAPLPTRIEGDGTGQIEKPRYEPATQRVYLNATQYVGPVPPEVWSFPIGGYQPAQKWLKDRQGRVLTFDESRHYQRLLAALAGTERLMREWEEGHKATME